MNAVATEAGVATGTAYVHYASKEELLLATYLEVKRDLMQAAVSRVQPGTPARQRFEQMWRGAHAHLVEDPDRARFLVQVDSSPFAARAHERATTTHGDPLLASPAVAELVAQFVPLPPRMLYDLALGPAVRAVAAGERLGAGETALLVKACWRAVTA